MRKIISKTKKVANKPKSTVPTMRLLNSRLCPTKVATDAAATESGKSTNGEVKTSVTLFILNAKDGKARMIRHKNVSDDDVEELFL